MPQGLDPMPAEKAQLSISQNPKVLPAEVLAEFDPLGEQPIGEGAFAVVRLVRCKRTGERFALKCLEKYQLQIRHMTPQMYDEVKIQKAMGACSNIVKLLRVFDNQEHLCMLLEYCEKGPLHSYVEKAPGGRLQEADAAFYVEQIARGVDFMHQHSCLHRDLKLGNMLLTDRNQLKIADFGWSAEMHSDRQLKTTCGTSAYWAPELWEKGLQDVGVDLWAVGCMIYAILAGHLPFFGQDDREVSRKVLAMEFVFPPWFSNEACHATHLMLKREARRRMRCKALLAHPWLRKYALGPLPMAEPRAPPPLAVSPPGEGSEETPGTPGRQFRWDSPTRSAATRGVTPTRVLPPKPATPDDPLAGKGIPPAIPLSPPGADPHRLRPQPLVIRGDGRTPSPDHRRGQASPPHSSPSPASGAPMWGSRGTSQVMVKSSASTATPTSPTSPYRGGAVSPGPPHAPSFHMQHHHQQQPFSPHSQHRPRGSPSRTQQQPATGWSPASLPMGWPPQPREASPSPVPAQPWNLHFAAPARQQPWRERQQTPTGARGGSMPPRLPPKNVGASQGFGQHGGSAPLNHYASAVTVGAGSPSGSGGAVRTSLGPRVGYAF